MYLVNNKSNSINFDDRFHKQNMNYVYDEYYSKFSLFSFHPYYPMAIRSGKQNRLFVIILFMIENILDV